MTRFSGRRVLVTGASRGIGAATALRFAAEGADVAIVARTVAPHDHDHLAGSLNETAGRMRRYGGRVVVIAADIADEDDRARIVREAVDGLGGPIEILINNAAAGMFAPMREFPLKRRRIIFEVNVHAPLDLVQAVLPSMIERGEGWIVNLSSATARPLPNSNMAVYGSSKAALNRLTNGLAVEMAGTGVRVNTVEPRAAVMLALGVLMLMFEVIKGARPGAKYLMDYLLSLIVFGAAAAEFVLWPRFGTSTYFLLTLLTLVDFLSGIALRTRRSALAASAPAVSRKSARKSEQIETPVAEPQFEPAPAPIPAPIAAPVTAPPATTSLPAAASIAESVLLDHPAPVVAAAASSASASSAASAASATSSEVPSPGLQPGTSAPPSPDAPR